MSEQGVGEMITERSEASPSISETSPSKLTYTLGLDEAGTVVSVDQAGQQISSVRDFLGKNYLEILQGFPCPTFNSACELGGLLRKLLQGDENQFQHERRCEAQAGERHFRVVGTRLEGVDRQRILLFHEDVTQAKSDERALRLARFTLDQSADAIWWSDEEGHLDYVNDAACRLLGYTAPELLSKSVWDICVGLAEDSWQERSEALRKSVLRMECNCRARDGRLIPVEISLKYLRAEGRGFNCAYVRDITSRKQLEDEFRQAQKLEAVGRLAGGIAHDFNNLLTVINGYSSLVLDRLSADSFDRSALQEIGQAGARAATLTRQLLSFSRKHVVQPTIVDLNALLSGMAKMLTRILGEDIQVNLRTDPTLGRIKADPGQMEQVLMNLSVNARDAMEKGGKLSIETLNVEIGDERPASYLDLPKGSYVLLSVSDTGCGMDQETQSHLFEPFFTTKEPGKGTGLGLSTVYGIVTRAGGRISCQSAKNEGTTFAILLPRCQESPEASTPLSESDAPHGTETILLVEDERTVRAITRVVLERYGYRVLEASSGQEALAIASAPNAFFDLLVTDMVMPGMSGAKLVEEFRPIHATTPILIMSGYSESGWSDTEIRRRGVSYIQKPFLPQALATRVREILDRRAQLKGSKP